MLEHLLHALGLFPPPSLAEKGLNSAVAGMFSTKGLQGCCGQHRPRLRLAPRLHPAQLFSLSRVWLPLRLCSLSGFSLMLF